MTWLLHNAETLAFGLIVAAALVVTVPRVLKRRPPK